jgi:hypothetical protein
LTLVGAQRVLDLAMSGVVCVAHVSLDGADVVSQAFVPAADEAVGISEP